MRIIVMCRLVAPGWYRMFKEIYSPDGLCPTVHTQAGGNTKIKVLVDEDRGSGESARI